MLYREFTVDSGALDPNTGAGIDIEQYLPDPQATADAAAWAKVREALSSLVLRRPIFLREWGAMLRRQGYELAADVFRAIADALQAEAHADVTQEATDGSE